VVSPYEGVHAETKQDRHALAVDLFDRLLTIIEYVDHGGRIPEEWNGTEAMMKLTWVMYCIVENGWDKPVPPWPGDVSAKAQRDKEEIGLSLADPIPEVHLDDGRDDSSVLP
jgi:hypothetical protein